MTTHQLAILLDHIRIGFGDALKAATTGEFVEIVAAFRELPDQSLKELVKSLRKANAPQTDNGATATGPGTVIERIRGIQTGSIPSGESVDVSKLTAPQLKEILKAFNKPIGGTKPELSARIRELCVPTPQPNKPMVAGDNVPMTPQIHELDQPDPKAVEEGVRIFTELRDNKNLTITDVRAGFQRLRGYSLPVVEDISRRLKYTPYGSRTEILDRLLSNLEGIKMSQYRMDQILTGT